MKFVTVSDSDDEEAILWWELLWCIVCCVIATCTVMYMNHESIIETEYYYFAHRHSWVCYVGWSILNTFAVTETYFLLLITCTHFPVFKNLWIFLNNLLTHFMGIHECKDNVNSTLSKFDALLTKDEEKRRR